MKSFIEPGTGNRMELGKWYAISDSGLAYTDVGFETVELAQLWWSSFGFEEHSLMGDPFTPLNVPKYTPCAGWLDMDSWANCVKADDLYDFWKMDEPDMDLQEQD